MSQFPSHWQLQQAARKVRSGGIIAYPTEAVFGLGCDPACEAAVERLLKLKQRSPGKGLILVASDWNQLRIWTASVSRAQKQQLFRTWPGPVTWLLPAAQHCPEWLTGKHSTLAVRVSAHPTIQQLCRTLGHALVSTSANRSNQAPARSTLETRLRFGHDLDYLLAGSVGNQHRPTEIRDLASGNTVRSSTAD